MLKSSPWTWLPASRPQITLNPSRPGRLMLSRLLDEELGLLRPFLEPIERDFNSDFWLSMGQPPLALPHTLIGARTLFGPSVRHLNTDEQSFVFPLLLSMPGREQARPHIAMLGDLRGSIGVRFIRVNESPTPKYRNHQPSPALPREDLNAISAFLCGYFEGRGSAFAPHAPSFFRGVERDLIVYGCHRGDAFERRLEAPDEYYALLERCHADMADALQQQQQAELDAILGACIPR